MIVNIGTAIGILILVSMACYVLYELINLGIDLTEEFEIYDKSKQKFGLKK